jgi:ABC-type polysaccharide/polyol phosphate export permease
MGMPTYDIIGIISHCLFWTMVETKVALIACCLPTLRPILSLVAFGTAIASFGSFLQDLGSALGSTRTRTI